MADNEYDVQDQTGTYHHVEVRQSGWSSFWKWTARILIILVIGAVVIYAINAWLFNSDQQRQSDASESSGGEINLNINSDSGSGGSSDSGASN